MCRIKHLLLGCLFIVLLNPLVGRAKPKIAILDFELRDVTLAPNIPTEIARTASIKPLLEKQLAEAGYTVVQIDRDTAAKAEAGPGYLFDHIDLAADLGALAKADYVLIGRTHKPSYLFVYLMANLVDTRNKNLVGRYITEIKGSDKKLTQKGVETLGGKIVETLAKRP